MNSGYHLTRERLMLDLYRAYLAARAHKRWKPYQMQFEKHLEDNLSELCDSLWERTYRPRPSKCFVISDPTLREVFAADFRDRVVHHLYCNYVYHMFDRTFIEDSYSCRKGKGTLYGVRRMERHIFEESAGYARDCWVLKMDISGYFMHIDRRRLLSICLDTIKEQATRVCGKDGRRWSDVVDIDFLEYLTREVVLLNPVSGCLRYGRRSDWERLPRSKSLFHSAEGCGLPIGNLTSQLFSNVYLNVLDQWMKRSVGCRHYGRYVDDFYVVSSDRSFLASVVGRASDFLWRELGLGVNPAKTAIHDVKRGVPFLGCFLKPWRRYVERRTFSRMRRKVLGEAECAGTLRLRSVVNSYLGLLRHVNSYRVTQCFFGSVQRIRDVGLIVPFRRRLVLWDRTCLSSATS